MKVNKIVFEKIREEIKNQKEGIEFGGWLLIEGNEVYNIIFSNKEQSGGHVKLDPKDVLRLNPDERKHVKGWWHRHPIQGPSQIDRNQTYDLTMLWGECRMLILQPNNKIVDWHVIKAEDIIDGNEYAYVKEKKEWGLHE